MKMRKTIYQCLFLILLLSGFLQAHAQNCDPIENLHLSGESETEYHFEWDGPANAVEYVIKFESPDTSILSLLQISV